MSTSNPTDSQTSEIVTQTNVGAISREISPVYTFVWNVPDFLSLPKTVNYRIKSPHFTFSGMCWYISLYPNGETANQSNGWVGIYLMTENEEECFLKYTLGMRSVDGNDYDKVTFEYIFKNGLGFGRPKFIERSVITTKTDQLVAQGNVTFFCKVEAKVIESKETASQCTQSKGIDVLFQNLEELLNGEDADVIFKLKNEEFNAHKFFLKVRSPVFKSMFSHNMKENNNNVIEASDCDPTAFRDFLHFVYCGKVEELSVDTVFNLYFIADKYDVKELRNICVEFIVDNMSIDTFFEAMNIALRHDEQTLLKHATNCFVQNSTEIAETARWLLFLEDNHVAANELFLKALKSLKIKLSAEN